LHPRFLLNKNLYYGLERHLTLILLLGLSPFFKSPDNFEELKSTIDNIIKYKITKDHLKNYFNYLFIQANDYMNKKS